MKLECDVIKDIYTLYEEDELSPKVKLAVDAHLATCKECTKIYTSGIGFNELFKGNEGNEPTPVLDEKIKLHLKIKRITFIAIILFIIIVVSLVKDYMANRELIADAYNDMYQISDIYTEMVNNVKKESVNHNDYYSHLLFPFIEETNKFEENLNYFERLSLIDSPYGLYLKQDQFIDMLTILHSRYKQGDWAKVDENALERLKQYVNAHQELVREEYDKFHHGYSSYIAFANTKKMADVYEKINNFTYYYTRFHQLPETIVQKGDHELTLAIQKIFSMKNGKVTFEESNPLNEQFGVYYFTITDKEKIISGKIDSFTGNVFEANHDSHRLSKGETLLDESEVEEKALAFLENMYGEGNVEISSEGINFNISSNADLKVYSFSFILKASGYVLHTSYETKYMINFDARTGKLYSLQSPTILSPAFFNESYEVNVEKKQAIEIIKNEEDESTYMYQGLGIIKSMNSGEFVLVHIFFGKADGENRYINSKTGEKEKPYIDSH